MTPTEAINTLGIVVILCATFYAVFIELYPRSTLLMAGATASIVWGTTRGFFDSEAALASISLTTILLLILMTVIANILNEAGFFDWVSIKIAKFSRGSRRRLFIYLTLFTFLFSTFADNLTVMVIMGALTISLLQENDIPIEPYMTSEIIASNLGGASTLIGDFPNLIIAEKANIPFMDFVLFGGMLPANIVIQLVVLLFLLWFYRHELRESDDPTERVHQLFTIVTMGRREHIAIRDSRALVSGLGGVALTLVLFATESLHHIKPVTIAMGGAVLAMIASGLPHKKVIDEVGLDNVVAFFGLFILAGAIQATGIFDLIVTPALQMYAQNPVLTSFALMVFIAIVTAVVDAGPTTAAFIPLIASLETQVAGPPHFLWWTLSFGVLAGSSSTILGATAGQIVASQVERAMLAAEQTSPALLGKPIVRATGQGRRRQRGFVRRFTLAGAPSAVIMIAIATVYIDLLFRLYH